MVPNDLLGYLGASAAIAGSLVGLLFVSITLRYEAILGSSAAFQNRAIAAAAFTGLVNAMVISLLALMPDIDIGYVGFISALICLYQTVKLHAPKIGGSDFSPRQFLHSAVVYLAQLGDGGYLIVQPHNQVAVDVLAWTIFGALTSSLGRAWDLLQPNIKPAGEPVGEAPAGGAPAGGPSGTDG